MTNKTKSPIITFNKLVKGIISKMIPISNKIRDEFGTIKHYAKKRNLNYGSLRLVLSGNESVPYIEKILKKDGFLKKYNKKTK